MKIGTLIEARLGSTRLHRKVLMPIGEDRTLIDLVYDRCKLAGEPEVTAVIMPDGDWELLNHCKDRGMRYFMASRRVYGNVMKEIWTAMNYFQLDMVVEITGDCPWVDYEKIDETLYAFSEHPTPHICMSLKPKGMEVRVVSWSAMAEAIHFMQNWERNGTTIFYDHPKWVARSMPCEGHGEEHQIDYSVDTDEDLEFARWLYKEVPWDARCGQVLSAMRSHPNILTQQLARTSLRTSAVTTPGPLMPRGC